MSERIDISVITPFYKGNMHMEQLFGCIRRNAAAAQGIGIELILVNDSPDTPIEYDEKWVEGFTLQIVQNPVNVGIQRTRINGISVARGAFIQMLDQDDVLEDDALQSQYTVLGDADIVLANGRNENRSVHKPIYRSLAEQRIAATPRFYYTVSNQIVSPGQCLLRRDAIPQAWLQDSIGRNGSDDLLLWLMLFECNARWVINPRCLYIHKDTGRNLSNDIGKMVESSAEVLEVLRNNGMITPRRERQYVRGRRMAHAYIGKSAVQKLFAALRYPDIAWQRLLLAVSIRQ